MAIKTAPSQGLSYGWVRGEDFWGGPVNDDLLYIDSMICPLVQSMSFSSPPATLTDGDKYLIASPATGDWAGQEKKLAVRIEGAWVFYTPQEGWRVRLKSASAFIWYNGESWENEQTGEDPDNPGTDPTVKPTYYDISVTATDELYADEAVVHMPLLDALMLPANMNGSALDMLSAAQAYSQLRVQRNGQSVGTITVNPGGYNATFATTGGNAVLFAKGDRLTIRAPSDVVQSFKNFGFTIRLNYV
jgi:hypothetical protein